MQEYNAITNGIFNQPGSQRKHCFGCTFVQWGMNLRHRGTMLDVAKGVFEFNEDTGHHRPSPACRVVQKGVKSCSHVVPVEDLNQLFGPDLELAELRHLQLIQELTAGISPGPCAFLMCPSAGRSTYKSYNFKQL